MIKFIHFVSSPPLHFPMDDFLALKYFFSQLITSYDRLYCDRWFLLVEVSAIFFLPRQPLEKSIKTIFLIGIFNRIHWQKKRKFRVFSNFNEKWLNWTSIFRLKQKIIHIWRIETETHTHTINRFIPSDDCPFFYLMNEENHILSLFLI